MQYIAEDLGMSTIKAVGPQGGVQLPAQVAVNGTATVSQQMGLKQRQPPLKVNWCNGEFYVGAEAHDWGRPVENLNYDRLLGAPEMTALVYGSFTRYMQTHGVVTDQIGLMAGLPLEMLMGESAAANADAVRA